MHTLCEPLECMEPCVAILENAPDYLPFILGADPQRREVHGVEEAGS